MQMEGSPGARGRLVVVQEEETLVQEKGERSPCVGNREF